MSGCVFEKDGKWWAYDYVDVVDLDVGAGVDVGVGRLREVEANLLSQGWQDIKLVIGGRFGTCIGLRGVRPETQGETDNRLLHDKAYKERTRAAEVAEYERLKGIYG